MRIASLAARACLASLVSLALPATGLTQVLVPQPGFGTFNVNYQWAHAKFHLFSVKDPATGSNRLDLGPMDSQTMFMNADYCFVRGLDVLASANFVAARYLGADPERPTDTSTFQHSPQDGTLGLHYVAGFEGITVAGGADYSFPMTDYITEGHNALGRGIQQLGLSLSLSRALPKIPGAVAAVGVGHDFEENVGMYKLGTNHFTASLGYFATDKISLNSHFSYSQTKNGFDWADPNNWADGGGMIHDPAAEALVRTAGGSVNYQFSSSYGIGIDVTGVLSGANTTDPMTYTLLTSYNFWSPFARRKAGF